MTRLAIGFGLSALHHNVPRARKAPHDEPHRQLMAAPCRCIVDQPVSGTCGAW